MTLVSAIGMNLFQWLADQPFFPKVYYCDKESGVERAAIGAARTFAAPPQEIRRCYGGICFPSRKQERAWGAFGPCRFWEPLQEIVQDIYQTFNEESGCSVLRTEESVLFPAFAEQIHFIKQQIHAKEIEKVVLARRRVLTLEKEPSVWQLLPRLQARSQNATVFAFQMDEKTTFFGASPETFFRRKGRTLVIDALAGSSKEGFGNKEANEFAYVKQFIERVSMPFASHFRWLPQEQVLATSHLRHLYNAAHLDVAAHFSDAALIRALHPTPAVGGVDRDKALCLIEALEPFQRGWYAAPVGYLSQDESHLCVGLRSALLCANQLHIYAGAGIVAESSAQDEWDEIDLKMELLMNLSA